MVQGQDASTVIKSKDLVKNSRPAGRSDMHVPHDTERMIEPHPAQWMAQAVTRCLATVMFVLGVAILLGGSRRFSGLSYQFALETPGAPWSWGTLAIIAGSLCLAGTFIENNRMVAVGAFACGFWALFFAITFARAAAAFEQANSTAMVAYGGYAVLFFTVAGAHLAMSPIRFRKGQA